MLLFHFVAAFVLFGIYIFGFIVEAEKSDLAGYDEVSCMTTR